jgi:hypothetical protein
MKIFTEVKSEKVPKAESRMDALWQIGIGISAGTDLIYLHLEPQGTGTGLYQEAALQGRYLGRHNF